MNKKLLFGLLLVLLLLPCIALADTCDICGDKPTVWQDGFSDVDQYKHYKYCEHGVSYAFSHDFSYAYSDYSHWKMCSECSYSLPESEAHYAYCTNKTVCSCCGAPYSGDTFSHSYNDIYKDEKEHWCTCADCNEEADRGAHWRLCDKNECDFCYAPYTGDSIIHNYDLDVWASDGEYHWHPCKNANCTAQADKAPHSQPCSSPDSGSCAECGADYTGDNLQHDIDWDTWCIGSDSHWHGCNACPYMPDEEAHAASCIAPGVCEVCGSAYSGENIAHQAASIKHDDQFHWIHCGRCGQDADKSEHFFSCTAPGVCGLCGIDCPDLEPIHEIPDNPGGYSETQHWWICYACHEQLFIEDHIIVCTDREVCYTCGAPVDASAGFGVLHEYSEDVYEHDSAFHWNACANCDEKILYITHFRRCIDPEGECEICHYQGNVKTIHSSDPSTIYPYPCLVTVSETPASCLTDGAIVSYCSACDKNITEMLPATGRHTESVESQTPATCLADGSITYRCSACGQARTETIPATGEHTEEPLPGRAATCTRIGYTEGTGCSVCGEVLTARQSIPMLEHDWQQSETIAAACTTEGRIVYACSVCGASREEVLPANGHQFGAYHSLNNGTHAAECKNGCGETKVRDCDYEDVSSGLFTYSTCKVCAYTKYSVPATQAPEASVEPAAAPAPDGEAPAQPEGSASPAQPETTEAPDSTLEPEVETVLVKLVEEIAAAPEAVEIKQVENAAIAPVPAANDETEEAPAAVIPENAQLIVHEQALPQESTSLPGARLFHIALSVDGYAVEHTGTVQIELPAPEAIDHAVMRLVLLQPDGSMIEIPYEIMDGKLVFSTELLGVFALVPVAAI